MHTPWRCPRFDTRDLPKVSRRRRLGSHRVYVLTGSNIRAGDLLEQSRPVFLLAIHIPGEISIVPDASVIVTAQNIRTRTASIWLEMVRE